MRSSKRTTALIGAGLLAAGLSATAIAPYLRPSHILHPKSSLPIVVPGKDGDATLLFNGWKISPVGRPIPTNDFLLGGAFSPDGKTLAIANCGYNPHAIHLIDVATEKEIANLGVLRTWNGIAWAKDGKTLYVSGGIPLAHNDVLVYEKGADDAWTKTKTFGLTGNDPKKTAIAGMSLSADGKSLFVLNNSDNKLYILETTTGKTVSSLDVGDHPFACGLNSDGTLLGIANIGGSEVVAVRVENPEKPEIVSHLPTGDHPNDLTLSTDNRLFVSCGSADQVDVFDATSGQPIETIRTTLSPNAPSGSGPNSVAVSPDNKTLYVANEDNNDVCVVDISERGKAKVKGFIPTGWFPTNVKVSPNGKKLIIGTGKGTGTGPNEVKLPINPDHPGGFVHHGHQLKGMISFLDVPDDAKLAEYTKQVMANTPHLDSLLADGAAPAATAVPVHVGDPSPIKHVLYIIKENRTYDQMFGDVAKGNGDPKLCLFGLDVTPNHHALASQFVLLDNLYCSGEVSQDGHPWSTSAITTDFNQRAWVLGYSGKGETVSSGSVDDPKAGYIWDACKRKGISYRTYGEYADHPSLKDHSCLEFIGKVGPNIVPVGRDMNKADIYLREFKEMEGKGTVPAFSVMSLGEDHTAGTAPGSYAPKAMVGSNDQAIGKIVEGISHSSLWKEFAIFIIEDDAQNGPDHVDSHRTMGLVISPYIKRGTVDSSLYSTASMLRTMELILGLPPLTQYDEAAKPMFNSFTNKADLTPYTLSTARIDINVKNTAVAYGAKESLAMDFSDYDRADADTLNRILWHSIKGKDVPMPAPVTSAHLRSNGTALSTTKPSRPGHSTPDDD